VAKTDCKEVETQEVAARDAASRKLATRESASHEAPGTAQAALTFVVVALPSRRYWNNFQPEFSQKKKLSARAKCLEADA
jgi:hypothetical protein